MPSTHSTAPTTPPREYHLRLSNLLHALSRKGTLKEPLPEPSIQDDFAYHPHLRRISPVLQSGKITYRSFYDITCVCRERGTDVCLFILHVNEITDAGGLVNAYDVIMQLEEAVTSFGKVEEDYWLVKNRREKGNMVEVVFSKKPEVELEEQLNYVVRLVQSVWSLIAPSRPQTIEPPTDVPTLSFELPEDEGEDADTEERSRLRKRAEEQSGERGVGFLSVTCSATMRSSKSSRFSKVT